MRRHRYLSGSRPISKKLGIRTSVGYAHAMFNNKPFICNHSQDKHSVRNTQKVDVSAPFRSGLREGGQPDLGTARSSRECPVASASQLLYTFTRTTSNVIETTHLNGPTSPSCSYQRTEIVALPRDVSRILPGRAQD